MTSKGLQERILRACYDFIDAAGDRYKQERNDEFYNTFKTFVKKETFNNLLRRGCNEDLKQQW